MEDQQFYQLLVGIAAGLGLSAACGFRVFVPPLALCLASRAGMVTLDPEWAALFDSDWTVGVLGVAAAAELAAYAVPWVDNLIDGLAAPAAFLAGTILTASCVSSIDPAFQWVLAAIVGGGSATAIHLGTAAVRAGSSMTTGGLGNPLVAAVEAVTATVAAVLALLAPLLAVVLVVLLLVASVRAVARRCRRRPAAAAA